MERDWNYNFDFERDWNSNLDSHLDSKYPNLDSKVGFELKLLESKFKNWRFSGGKSIGFWHGISGEETRFEMDESGQVICHSVGDESRREIGTLLHESGLEIGTWVDESG